MSAAVDTSPPPQTPLGARVEIPSLSNNDSTQSGGKESVMASVNKDEKSGKCFRSYNRFFGMFHIVISLILLSVVKTLIDLQSHSP